MLGIEIEFLAGIVYAASIGDRAEPEWPPHPDRLFSALVSTWGERGHEGDERHALEWLEQQPAPQIAAPTPGRREVVEVFVPPNDFKVPNAPCGSDLPSDTKTLRRQLAVLPELRQLRQPRFFPALTLPVDSAGRPERVHFSWPGAEPSTPVIQALRRLVRRTASLGHPASLVRMDLVDVLPDTAVSYHPDPGGRFVLRWVYPGRLTELERAFHGTGARGSTSRPGPGPGFRYAEAPYTPAAAPESIFGEAWVVFADAGGEAPGLIAFAHVAKAARDALLAFTPNPAPEVLSGHGADGNPSTRPHLAVVPLADVGWMHSTGRLLGFAFVLPRVLERDRAASDRQAALEAMVRFARSREPEPAGLRLGRLGLWLVARTGLGALRSLDPSRYVGPARRWATVTPLMLDRYPKDRDDENAEAVVGQSCENLGLPRPTLTALYKHSAVRGAPSARPSARSPEWTSWTFPRSDSAIRRPLVHAILEFEQPVRGPLILGAGRYLGLGLCLPIDRG